MESKRGVEAMERVMESKRGVGYEDGRWAPTNHAYARHVEEEEKKLRANDSVNHPVHYNVGKIEVLEFLEDQFEDRPHEWNAVKYICRAPYKASEIEDLKKAVFYLQRKIHLLECEKDGALPKRPNEMVKS